MSEELSTPYVTVICVELSSTCGSTELVALAAEKGYLVDEIGTGKKALEAALYAVKYMGCSVSAQEIEGFLGAKK